MRYRRTSSTNNNDENTDPNEREGTTYRSRRKQDEESGDDSHSDPEEGIQASHPKEDARIKLDSDELQDDDSNQHTLRFLRKNVWNPLKEGKVWWVHCTTIALAALLTYSFHNVNAGPGGGVTNLQIAIMTVITLFGASPFCATHLIPASIGAFVGGHNIVGSTSEYIQDDFAGEVPYTNYLWLLLLSAVVGLVWCFVINHPSLKILDGFAGRLGTTTFIGMNVTMIAIFGPVGVTDWNRYYYGFVHAIPLAEEDSSISLAGAAWSWSEEVELAVGYVLSVLWLGVVAGANRILHQRHIQRWERNNQERLPGSNAASKPPPPKPLNNVLIPVLWALFSMLIVNATQYAHAPGLYNGFAVGAYVAMASLQKLPSIVKFATVSLVAAFWGLLLTPFFVGFAGKSGFTSMLGHVTYSAVERLLHRFRIRKQQELQEERQRSQQRQINHSKSEDSDEDNLYDKHLQRQKHDLSERRPLHRQEEQKSAAIIASAVEQYAHSRKYIKPKESLLTKQQRRQQQRLKHLRQQQEQKPEQRPSKEADSEAPKLHHRAWSALPETGHEEWQHWQHPLEHESGDEIAKNGSDDNRIV